MDYNSLGICEERKQTDENYKHVQLKHGKESEAAGKHPKTTVNTEKYRELCLTDIKTDFTD